MGARAATRPAILRTFWPSGGDKPRPDTKKKSASLLSERGVSPPKSTPHPGSATNAAAPPERDRRERSACKGYAIRRRMNAPATASRTSSSASLHGPVTGMALMGCSSNKAVSTMFPARVKV